VDEQTRLTPLPTCIREANPEIRLFVQYIVNLAIGKSMCKLRWQ
jgi:hypothetical protein